MRSWLLSLDGIPEGPLAMFLAAYLILLLLGVLLAAASAAQADRDEEEARRLMHGLECRRCGMARGFCRCVD